MARGREPRSGWSGWSGWIAAALLLCAGGLAPAQESDDLPPEYTSTGREEIILTGCKGCGPGGSFDYDPAYPVDSSDWAGCGAGGCTGQRPCYDCQHKKTCLGRFFCCLYECICCPDPCYEPHWLPVADAAFFTEGFRPITQERFRWDYGQNVRLPDRNGYFWAPIPFGPIFPETGVTYHEITKYIEAASKLGSIWFEVPYRSLEPEVNPGGAGFGDIKIGTKALMFDCELLQITMQTRNSIPSASTLKGVGNGIYSLEPSLLIGLKIGPETYLQAQVSEWIPFGGNPLVLGPILHYHLSLNHVLWRPLPDLPLIGTCEFSGYSFQTGAYTDPNLVPAGTIPSPDTLAQFLQPSNGYSYLYLGGGLRLFICNRLDFGVGAQLSLQRQHWADPLIRSEFRIRF